MATLRRPWIAAAAAAILTIAPILLGGCGSPQSECQKTYGAGTPGYQACWAAELQRENAEADRRREEAGRSNG